MKRFWTAIKMFFTDPGQPCPARTDVDKYGRNPGHAWYPGGWGDNTCTLCGTEGWIEYGR